MSDLSLDVRTQLRAAVALRTPQGEMTFGEVADELGADPGPSRIGSALSRPNLVAIWRALAYRRPMVMLPDEWSVAQCEAAWRAASPILGDRAIACVLFTSGSTGTPRGVIHTRASVAAALSASAHHLGWRDDDAWLLALPLAHAGGLAVVLRCLAAGRPIVCADSPDAALNLRPTLASLVPTQVARLAQRTAPSTLRAVLVGGASADHTTIAEAAARGWPTLQTYGMTETFGQVATQALGDAGRSLADAPMRCLPGVTIVGGTQG